MRFAVPCRPLEIATQLPSPPRLPVFSNWAVGVSSLVQNQWASIARCSSTRLGSLPSGVVGKVTGRQTGGLPRCGAMGKRKVASAAAARTTNTSRAAAVAVTVVEPAEVTRQQKAGGRRRKAAASIKPPSLVSALPTEQLVVEAPAANKKRQSRSKKAPVDALPASIPLQAAEAAEVEAALLATAEVPNQKAKRARKPQAAKSAKSTGTGFLDAVEAADAAAQQEISSTVPARPAPKRRTRKKATMDLHDDAAVTVDGAAAEDGSAPEPARAPKRRRTKVSENAFVVPGRQALDAASQLTLPARPAPNFGYACLNMGLREQKPSIFTNRGCIQKTFLEKGLPYISSLVLENANDLAGLIAWNHEHGVRFFRISSEVFPWCTEYQPSALPDFEAISERLAFAGALARAYDQRLTFHPSHFVKLAAAEPKLLARSIQELEVHSQMLDLMGFTEASPTNKINIHIGGVYGDKEGTLERFAENFKRLSSRCRARLTVENDDLANSFSIRDLMPLHRKIGVPLVFDFHHHRFCSGREVALEADGCS